VEGVRQGIKYYLNFFITCFKISLKQTFEFKYNFYSAFFLGLIYTTTLVFFAHIFADLTYEVIGWQFVDFILFIFIMGIFLDFTGIFWYGYHQNLPTVLKNGIFNTWLCKPGNPFWIFLLKDRYNPIVFIMIDFLIYIPFLSYLGDWSLVNIFFGILVLLFLVFVNILFIHFLISFSWIAVELGDWLVGTLYWGAIVGEFKNYPFQIFNNSSILKYCFAVLPLYFVSMVLVPLISKGVFPIDVYQFAILFSVVVVCVVGIWFNWRYGLKRYEAYG